MFVVANFFSGRHFRLFCPYRSTLSYRFKQSILLSGNAEKCVTNAVKKCPPHWFFKELVNISYGCLMQKMEFCYAYSAAKS